MIIIILAYAIILLYMQVLIYKTFYENKKEIINPKKLKNYNINEIKTSGHGK